MIKLGIFLFILMGFTFHVKANNECDKKYQTDIKEILITDSILLEQLIFYINERNNDTSLFSTGRGYVTIFMKGSSSLDGKKVRRSYSINVNYHSFDNLKNDFIFPNYYTKIQDRIVIIYDSSFRETFCLEFTSNTKKNFQRIVEPFLPPFSEKRFKIRDKNGKIVKGPKFRPDDSFQLHGSRTLYIFEDDDIEPIIIKNHY